MIIDILLVNREINVVVIACFVNCLSNKIITQTHQDDENTTLYILSC